MGGGGRRGLLWLVFSYQHTPRPPMCSTGNVGFLDCNPIREDFNLKEQVALRGTGVWMKHCIKYGHTLWSRKKISVIMQDGSAANRSVCLWERSLPSAEHWTILHGIKPQCDVKCKVCCRGALRHPPCSTLPHQRIYTVELNSHGRGTRSSEEALCIQVGPCLFVFAVSPASALFSAFALLVSELCLKQVLGFEEPTESIAVLPFARGRERHSLWRRCNVVMVCAGRGGENHLPRVSNVTLTGLVQAALFEFK